MTQQFRAIVTNSGTFRGRSLLVLTGSVLGQGIAVMLLPFITRLYLPQELGHAASSLAIVSIVGIVACMQYDQALIVAADEDVPYIIALSISVSLSILLTLLALSIVVSKVFPYWQSIVNHYNVNSHLVILTMIHSLFLLFTNYRLRSNNIMLVGIGRAVYYGGSSVLQVTIGFQLGGTSQVFLFSQGLACVAALLILFPFKEIIRWLAEHRTTSVTGDQITSAARRTLGCAQTYINFPKYQAGAQLLNVFSVQMPVIFVGTVFSTAWAAWYFVAWRILGTPTALLSQAVGQVFFRDSAELIRQGHKVARQLERLGSSLIQISLIMTISIVVVFPPLSTRVLGNEWSSINDIVQILLLSFMATFITSPISTLLSLTNQQHIIFRFQLLLFSVRMAAIVIGWLLHDAWLFLIVFSCLSFLVYIGLFLYIVKNAEASMQSILLGVVGWSRFLRQIHK